MTGTFDTLDAELLTALAERPRIGMLELARQLRVARNTAQARLDALQRDGIVTGFPPAVDLAALGYQVAAYTSVELEQGWLVQAIDALSAIPEILEAHATAGNADLLCKVVAVNHPDLQRVLQQIIALPGVRRTTTSIVLSSPVPPRLLPLLQAHAAGTPRGRTKDTSG